jgi:hypothetical protein
MVLLAISIPVFGQGVGESINLPQKADKPFFQAEIEKIEKAKTPPTVQGLQKQMIGQEQMVDAARAVNGTWQTEGTVYLVTGVMPHSAVETWRYDAGKGIFYDGGGWMWGARTSGPILQAMTRAASGSLCMMTIYFQSYDDATWSLNVQAQGKMPPCRSEGRARRMK